MVRPVPPADTADQRRGLRRALADRHPWLADTDVGPQAVEAGECDRCGVEARLVQVCGPGPWGSLGRRCAAELGSAAWCDGHVDDAQRALTVLAALPVQVDDIARLWWVATGEVRVDHDLSPDAPARPRDT